MPLTFFDKAEATISIDDVGPIGEESESDEDEEKVHLHFSEEVM